MRARLIETLLMANIFIFHLCDTFLPYFTSRRWRGGAATTAYKVSAQKNEQETNASSDLLCATAIMYF